MSDDCEWSVGDFYSETFPVARKQYACCECTAPIVKGEQHLRAAGKSDGSMWDERQHMLCRKLCMHMNSEGDGCCYFGGMTEEYREGDWWMGVTPESQAARAMMFGIMRREVVARRASEVPH